VGDKWADLLPSDYVSPADSDDGPSDDIQKSNLLDSGFNNFNFSEFGILDSGLFSSDTPHTDPRYSTAQSGRENIAHAKNPKPPNGDADLRRRRS
jgi:hypothetical protein